MTELERQLAHLRARREGPCASDLELDRLLLRELEDANAEALRGRIAACAHCRRRLETLREFYEEFRARPPMIAFGRSSKVRWLGAGALTTAAAAAMFLVSGPGSPPGVIRLKGPDRFGYTIVAPDGRIRGDELLGAARPGDELQWRFRARQDSYVAVLSRGSDGRVSVYFPGGTRAAPIRGGAEQVLPTAVRLDGLPGNEELFGLICTEPVELGLVQAALHKKTPLPPACTTYRHTVAVKDGP